MTSSDPRAGFDKRVDNSQGQTQKIHFFLIDEGSSFQSALVGTSNLPSNIVEKISGQCCADHWIGLY
jgi:hypothetical protein